MSKTGYTDLRVEMPDAELAVLDGYVSATGKDRTKVVRQIIREWSERKLHEATIVIRVAGRNPSISELDRT